MTKHVVTTAERKARRGNLISPLTSKGFKVANLYSNKVGNDKTFNVT